LWRAFQRELRSNSRARPAKPRSGAFSAVRPALPPGLKFNIPEWLRFTKERFSRFGVKNLARSLGTRPFFAQAHNGRVPLPKEQAAFGGGGRLSKGNGLSNSLLKGAPKA
ncbi:MAG: hypothetical protein HQL95_15840, partial [Magnetococcales bacterium]|nr:hypothetical protein [Magnetococcales bacterium]